MKDYNLVHIVGTVAADPDVQVFQSGKCKASIQIVCTEEGRNGQVYEETAVISLWGSGPGDFAEIGAGVRIVVHGKASSWSYTSREGKDRTNPEIKVKNYTVIAPTPAEAEPAPPPSEAPPTIAYEPEEDLPF